MNGTFTNRRNSDLMRPFTKGYKTSFLGERTSKMGLP